MNVSLTICRYVKQRAEDETTLRYKNGLRQKHKLSEVKECSYVFMHNMMIIFLLHSSTLSSTFH